MQTTRTCAQAAMAAAMICVGASHGLADQGAREQTEEHGGVKVFGIVVHHPSGNPVEGSRVSLSGLSEGAAALAAAVTTRSGRFSFTEVPAGSYVLTVTSRGYAEFSDSLDVPVGRDLQALVTLSVGSPASALRLVGERTFAPPGLEARRRGGRGFIMTREEIEASDAGRLTDLLGEVPGARVIYVPPAGSTLVLRGDCRPGVWLDGARMWDAPPLDLVASNQSVEAIEIYHGFDLPAEFGVDPCGGILIWTRRGGSPAGVASEGTTVDLIRRAGVAVGLVLLVVLLIR